jgi:hypothetical protein
LHAAHAALLDLQAFGWRNAFHEGVVLPAAFDTEPHALDGFRCSAPGGGDCCISGVERMNDDTIWRCPIDRRPALQLSA